jgi:anti-sigma factor RsiW
MSRGNEHDEIRERLALFVAGALAAGEEDRIARHTATCPSCAAEIERWQLISGGLRQLRTPQPSAALFEGTRALAEAELAAQTERRRSRIVLTLLTVFSWTITIAGWPVFRLVTSGLLSLLDIRFRELWILFAIFSALTWVAGGSAAVLLSARRRHERRLA